VPKSAKIAYFFYRPNTEHLIGAENRLLWVSQQLATSLAFGGTFTRASGAEASAALRLFPNHSRIVDSATPSLAATFAFASGEVLANLPLFPDRKY
jgi:hypothetical protein